MTECKNSPSYKSVTDLTITFKCQKSAMHKKENKITDHSYSMFIKSSQNEIFVVQKSKLYFLQKTKQSWDHAFHSRNLHVTLGRNRRQEYCKQHDGYEADNLNLTNNPAWPLLL